jgi:predicted hotdog family 3-hydroxylacyl-ACP dehydratase
MLAENDDVLNLIPQRPPMVMLHSLISCGEHTTESRLKIEYGNIFVEDGAFSASGMVENIAQTAAARVGYICLRENIPVPIGFIGAVKDLKIFFLPELNKEIHTLVTITHQVFDVTVIQGTIRCEGEIAAQCEMKIFIQKNTN